jgi:hypothetical protein
MFVYFPIDNQSVKPIGELARLTVPVVIRDVPVKLNFALAISFGYLNIHLAPLCKVMNGHARNHGFGADDG